ncbi:MAG TPA: 3-methyl-2-oxobutanoate hydroxymethyltransferase [Gemmatimonadales bacterium]|nr:3-methyl-2-oxobutanoate hydroxymethyltransferase [Gemmatimonadales bacterium]
MSAETRVRTIHDVHAATIAGRKLVMLTCYDALFARLLAPHVDILLVGDSVHQVLGGNDTTLGATLDQMIYHAKAVKQGAPDAVIVVDLPFLSYQVSVPEAIRNAGRVLAETGATAVKLEGGRAMVPVVKALVDVGIPVMGHLGLTPQSVHQLGGYRVQGRESAQAERLMSEAALLEDAGIFALVLVLMPRGLAKKVTDKLQVPTIGIGAGPDCDGQVLVLHDMLGLNEGFTPKFLKKYAELAGEVKKAAEAFGKDVRDGRYPGPEHSFD